MRARISGGRRKLRSRRGSAPSRLSLGAASAKVKVAWLLVASALAILPAFSAPDTSAAPAPLTTPAAQYGVTFNESGLPLTATWWVNLGGSNLSQTAPNSIVFTEGNGTYSFLVGASVAAQAIPGGGQLAVNGAARFVNISFSQPVPKHRVEFLETGLPNNTLWSVNFSGVDRSAPAGVPLDFFVPDGVYSYTVSPQEGFKATPAAGTVRVAGQDVTVRLAIAVVGPPGPSGPANVPDWLIPSVAGSAIAAFAVGFAYWELRVRAVRDRKAEPDRPPQRRRRRTERRR